MSENSRRRLLDKQCLLSMDGIMDGESIACCQASIDSSPGSLKMKAIEAITVAATAPLFLDLQKLKGKSNFL